MKENSNPALTIEQEATSGLQIILASSSPRRRELVALLGLPYQVVPSRYEEPPAPDSPVNLPDFVTRLALGKAQEVAVRMRDEMETGAIALGADTLVAPDDDEIGVPLGKPRDEEDARRMLRTLSGRTHRVYTGIALLWKEKGDSRKANALLEETSALNSDEASIQHALSPFSFLLSPVCTRVRFRALTDTMIADYVATGEPLDKAGAYGAQGYAAPFIEVLEGDFFNVVGLPLCAVGHALESIQTDWWRHRSIMKAQGK